MNRGELIKAFAENCELEEAADYIYLFAFDKHWEESKCKRDKFGRFTENGSGNRGGKARNRERKQKTTQSNQRTLTISKKLKGYSPEEKKRFERGDKIVVCERARELSNFIKKARGNKMDHRKMYLGKINPKTANEVLKKTGVDIGNCNLTIGADEVRKIYKDHGNPKTEIPRGQRPIVRSDIESFADIVTTHDSVRLDSEKYLGHDMLVFEKKVGTKVTAAAYVSVAHNELRLQTMYAAK